VELLPTAAWLPVLALLLPRDLAAASASCRHLRIAASAPELWRGLRLRQSALLLHGLHHFLACPRYQQVTNIDFSRVGLEPSDLLLLLRRCRAGRLQHLDLSDKSFLGLEPATLADSLGRLHSLRLRYCSLSNLQVVLLLRAVTHLQRIATLDLLGASVHDRELPSGGSGPPPLSLLDCELLQFAHLSRDQARALTASLAGLPQDPLAHLTLDSGLLACLPPTLLVGGAGGAASLATLRPSWAQWSALLTSNIASRHLREVSLTGRGEEPAVLRLPYQLLGESLAGLTVLTIGGLRTSAQQAAALFLHIQQAESPSLRTLRLDQWVDLSGVPEACLTGVACSLHCLSLSGTVLSLGQLTHLLTHTMQQAPGPQELQLLDLALPKVHPNILGPGLAQTPELDLSGSSLTGRQWSSLLFSVLDTRRVNRLVLRRCDLHAANPSVLASAVAIVRSVDLANAKLDPLQVAELLRRCAVAKTLQYLCLEGVAVPGEVGGKEGEEVLVALRARYNVYTAARPAGRLLTSTVQ
jgi:hypothetical protein